MSTASAHIHAHEVVHRSRAAVAAGLRRLFLHHLRCTTNGSFIIDLPAHAIAELAAQPMNSMQLTPLQERWYPRFTGTVSLVPVFGAHTDVTIDGILEHGTGPISNRHYEREVAQKAIESLLRLVRHHFAARA